MDDEGLVLLLNVLKAKSRTDVTTAHVAMSGAYSIVAPSWGLSDKMFWISAREHVTQIQKEMLQCCMHQTCQHVQY